MMAMTEKKRETAATSVVAPERKNLWIGLSLHEQLKMRALQRRVSLQDLVEEYLKWALVTEVGQQKKKRGRKTE